MMSQSKIKSESVPAENSQDKKSWKTGLYSQDELDPQKMDKAIAQLKILNEYLRISNTENTTINKEVNNEEK